MNFSEISKLPYKHLPTDVLLVMRDQIRKELGSRGYIPDASDDRRSHSAGGLFGRERNLQQEKSLKQRLFDLDPIMAEDWSHLFPTGCEERRFYVYAHVNPRKGALKKGGEFKLHMPGLPFYIGKGTGNRAWQLNRNEGHGVELKMLRDQGVADSEIVHIVRKDLTEREALEIESKLIFFLGTKFESGRKGILVNLDFPKRPNNYS